MIKQQYNVVGKLSQNKTSLNWQISLSRNYIILKNFRNDMKFFEKEYYLKDVIIINIVTKSR